jgi:hypothetical protein
MAKLGMDVPVEPTFYPAHEVFAPQAVTITYLHRFSSRPSWHP